MHDFYSKKYPNVKKSVYDFVDGITEQVTLMPIGDTISMAIVV